MTKLKSYPKTEQLKAKIKEYIKNATNEFVGLDESTTPYTPIFKVRTDIDLTKTKFFISPKVHGSQAGVVVYGDGSIQVQSRRNILCTISNSGELVQTGNNAGFVEFVLARVDKFREMASLYKLNREDEIVLYGEYAGKGIQKGVGVNELDKFFMLFAAKRNSEWIPYNDLNKITNNLIDHRLYNTFMFGAKEYTMDITADNFMDIIQKMVDDVEECCPVAKGIAELDGIKLKNTTGEGIVLVWYLDGARLMCKAKGDKHKKVGPKKPKKKLFDSTDEEAKYINAVLEVLTDFELEQKLQTVAGIDQDITNKHIGEFIKYVNIDTMQEHSNDFVDKGLELNLLKPIISKRAKEFILSVINK